MSDTTAAGGHSFSFLGLESFGLPAPFPPPRFNGVFCPHYRKVKQYQRELEQGGVTQEKSVCFEGASPTDLVLWAASLPTEAVVSGTDYGEEVCATWKAVRPLTPGERLLRAEFIQSHPIPQGESDPEFIRWKRAVPFEVNTQSWSYPLGEKGDH